MKLVTFIFVAFLLNSRKKVYSRLKGKKNKEKLITAVNKFECYERLLKRRNVHYKGVVEDM